MTPEETFPEKPAPAREGEPLRLLLVEDSENDALLLVRELRKGGIAFTYERLETLEAVAAALDAGGVSAVISDFNLPGFDGLDVLRLVQTKGIDVPFLLVSGAIGDEKAVEAMKAGVHDYIAKGKYSRLVPALERELREARLRRERREAETELEEYRRGLEELVQVRTAELERVNNDLEEANEELQRNQELIKGILAGTSDLVYVKNREGKYLIFNRAAESFCGKSEKEVIGHDDTFLFPPDEARAVMERDRKVVVTGELTTCEDPLTGAAGEKRIFQSIRGPIFDAGRNVIGLFGASRDVTAVRQAEQALRESNEQLEELTKLLEYAPVLIRSMDDRITVWNSGMKQLYGYSAEEAIGAVSHVLLHTIFPQPMEEIRSILISSGTWQGELFHTAADGHEVIVASLWVVHKAVDGRPLAVIEVNNDITGLKHAEEELRIRERQFRQLAEALPHHVWMAGADGGIEYLNTTWYRYTGFPDGEAQAETWEKCLHPDDYERVMECWKRCVETGEPFEVEYRYRRADGGYRWFIGRNVPVFNSEGKIVRWFGTGTDIEAQKRAKEVAEAAARAKTDFMANMSHEIRTPMNGILGISELLLDTDLTALQRQYLDMVRGSGEALLSVVNDVLDFSKIEAGAMLLDKVEFDLRDLVEKGVETISIRAFQKGLELALVIQPDLPQFLLGDPGKLRQVLLNLVGNAVKFTEKGEVVVRVNGGLTDGDTCRLLFSVKDTGIGIPEDKQEMLFESFTQVDASTARSYGGTGLGLAISKRIVEKMGGHIRLESRVGEGSTFSFEIELPVVKTAPAPEPPLFNVLARLRALILDDNSTNRLMLYQALTAKGMVVEEASTGSEAIRKAFEAADEGRPFDLMLIDLHLPDMDGFQVAERLRERFPISSLALMMLTSDDVAGGARRARNLGMATYVVKPVRISALLEALVQVREAGRPAVSEQRSTAPVSVTRIPFCTHVLVAEDNPVNLTVTETILRKGGARVTAATNGIEAIETFSHDRFNVILMDVQMPEMDGLQATRILRAKGADIAIIGLTAHALEGDRERCLEAGMDDYLPKPVSAQALNEKVSYWARQRPLPAAEPGRLLSQFDGERDGVKTVYITFLDSAPAQLAEVKAAVEAADPVSLGKAAHRLKGALAVVTADVARCLAQEMENATKAEDLSNVPEILARLEEEVERVMAQLRVEIAV